MKIDLRAGIIALSVATATLGLACDKSTAEADRKAAEAAKEAQEANDKANAARLKAADELAKARAAHTDARMKLQKDLDAHGRKAAYLKEKAAKLTGDAKKNADAAVAELDARHTKAKAGMAKLEDDTQADWEALRKSAEDDIASVGKGVDALETTVTKK